MILRVTLDQSRIEEMRGLPAFRELKNCENKGRVKIFDPHASPTSGKVERRPAPWEKRASMGQLFQQIAALLFPNQDTKRLSMPQINCVAHLVNHHQSGREIFVTTNEADFILHGKQARLQAVLKIVVLTPAEAVAAVEATASKASMGADA